MINLFNIQEILVFFRYKTFPIFIGLLFLSSFFYVYWTYYQTKKKFFFFLALGGGLIFFKEFLLFIATRRLLVDLSLPRIEFSFFQWMSLEMLINFLATVSIAYAFCTFKLDKNINYISTVGIKKKLRLFLFKHGLFIFIVITAAYFMREVLKVDLSILLPLMMAFYFIVLRSRLLWMKKNFVQFSISGFTGKSQKFFNLFILMQLIIFLFFSASAFSFTPLNNSLFFDKAFIYGLLDVWIHPIKAVSFAFLAAGFFTVVRNEQIATAKVIENREMLREKLASFEKNILTRMIDLDSPKEIFDDVVNLLFQHISPEMCCIKLKHVDRLLFTYVSGETNWEGVDTAVDELPYIVDLFRDGKDIVVDDFSKLSVGVREHFQNLPLHQEELLDVNELIRIKQRDFKKNKEVEGGLSGVHTDVEIEEKIKIQQSKGRHVVNNLLFSKTKNSQKMSLSIVIVNKKQDTAEVWDEAGKLAVMKVLSEIVLNHWHYFLHYSEYKMQKQREASNKVVEEMEKVIHEIDKVYTDEKHTDRSNPNIDLSWGSVYSQRRLRSFIRTAGFSNHHVIMACDIVGNVQWTFLFHSILQTSLGKVVERNKNSMEILKALSEVLKEFRSDSFVNALALSFDNETKVLTYSNASYLPLLIFKKSTGQMVSYDLDGLPLGVQQDSNFKNEDIPLESGDIVVIQSEKLLDEKRVASARSFSTSELLETIKNNAKLSSEKIVNAIVHEIRAVSGSVDAERDARMIGIIKVL